VEKITGPLLHSPIEALKDEKANSEAMGAFTAPTGDRFIKLAITDAVSAGGQPIAAIGELDVVLED
jgi:hypothetical protein